MRKFIKTTLHDYQLIRESQGKKLKELLELLSGYNLSKGDYAIFGSAPLLVLGKIDSINDLDVIVRPSKWPFQSVGEYRTGDIEFFDNWPGFDVDELIDNHTFEYEGFLFIDPDQVIKYKRKLKRDKDREIWEDGIVEYNNRGDLKLGRLKLHQRGKSGTIYIQDPDDVDWNKSHITYYNPIRGSYEWLGIHPVSLLQFTDEIKKMCFEGDLAEKYIQFTFRVVDKCALLIHMEPVFKRIEQGGEITSYFTKFEY